MKKKLAQFVLAEVSFFLLICMLLCYPTLPSTAFGTCAPDGNNSVFSGALHIAQTHAFTTLRVGTYNVKHFAQGAHDFSQYAAIIRAAELDVLALQEVDNSTKRSNGLDEARLLAEELGLHYTFAPAIPLEGGEYGLAILSRYPMGQLTIHKYTTTDAEQRILSSVTVTIDGVPIRILNTHLSPDLHDSAGGTALRAGQFAQLSAITEDLNSYILLGDLNTDTPSELALVPHIRWANVTERMLITCPAGNAAIDNIGTGRTGRFSNVTVVPSPLSDHDLLYADVTILAAK